MSENKLTKEAKKVVEDYVKNPSEMSGSLTQVHENSPYLATKKERLKEADGLNEMFGGEETNEDK